LLFKAQIPSSNTYQTLVKATEKYAVKCQTQQSLSLKLKLVRNVNFGVMLFIWCTVTIIT